MLAGVQADRAGRSHLVLLTGEMSEEGEEPGAQGAGTECPAPQQGALGPSHLIAGKDG